MIPQEADQTHTEYGFPVRETDFAGSLVSFPGPCWQYMCVCVGGGGSFWFWNLVMKDESWSKSGITFLKLADENLIIYFHCPN